MINEIIEKCVEYSQYLATLTEEVVEDDGETSIEKAARLLSETARLLQGDGNQLRLPFWKGGEKDEEGSRQSNPG